MKSYTNCTLKFGSEGKCTHKYTIKKAFLKNMGDCSFVSIHI